VHHIFPAWSDTVRNCIGWNLPCTFPCLLLDTSTSQSVDTRSSVLCPRLSVLHMLNWWVSGGGFSPNGHCHTRVPNFPPSIDIGLLQSMSVSLLPLQFIFPLTFFTFPPFIRSAFLFRAPNACPLPQFCHHHRHLVFTAAPALPDCTSTMTMSSPRASDRQKCHRLTRVHTVLLWKRRQLEVRRTAS
jgi:hypothetical protein